MAWPCITRACCINRYWSDLDKGDIAVPLVFTRYPDAADVPHVPYRAGALETQTQAHPGEREAGRAPPATRAAAAVTDDSTASVMRQDFKAWRVRPEPSCKPRDEYQRSTAPFNNETQYQKDYKPWPIPKKHDHPWIPKAGPTATSGGPERSAGSGRLENAATEAESGAEKSEIEEKMQEKEMKETTKTCAKREESAERQTGEKTEAPVPSDPSAEQRRGRAAADALNRQIQEVLSTSSSYRTEFQAYKDVKPEKPIKAPSQYKLPAEEPCLETCYSATFKGEQGKPHPADNKAMERRRIRSLYREPGKVDKPVSRITPKKKPTTTTGTMVKKSKEKQIAGSQSAKKKPSLGAPEPKPGGVVTKKSKEMSNRLAEAKL